jgi:glutathione S-transferase
MEGAFDASSRFRPEAMNYLQTHRHTDDLTFPLLVDATTTQDKPIVLTQSYDILEHLWKNYGQNVLPNQHRPDQKWNSSQIPFPLRFLSLAGPSYMRPWPTSGILQTPSLWDKNVTKELTLYQAEGCPESRLTREVLCTLELPYQSIPVGHNSSNSLPVDGINNAHNNTPVLIDGDYTLQGAHACSEHLWNKYRDPNGKLPVWWNPKPYPNLGRAGSFGVGAYTAFLTGSRAFVPSQAMQ